MSVWVQGFRVVGVKVQGEGCGFGGFSVKVRKFYKALEFGILGFRVQEFWVQGLGIGVLVFRVWGFRGLGLRS